MQARADRQLTDRKKRDRLFVLLIVGATLLLPPLAGLSLLDSKLYGIPLPVIYLFSVWVCLIFFGRYLSLGLRDSDSGADGSDRSDRSEGTVSPPLPPAQPETTKFHQ